MTSVREGTESFNEVSAQVLGETCVYTGTALPVGAANKVPQYGKFLLVDSLSTPTTATWYIQTSATLSSPSFVELPDTGGLDMLPYLKLSTTIGDYSQPASATATSRAIDTSYLFFDDFSGADNWTDTGTNVAVNTTTDVIDFSASTDNTGTVYDLGSNMSDSAWVLRFKLTTAVKTNGGNYQMLFGLFSASGANNTTPSQDFLGLRGVVTGALNQYNAYYGDGVVMNAGSNQAFATAIAVNTYYVEIKRTSTTNFTVELFSDADFSTSVEQESVTIASTIASLRYIKFISMNFGAGGAYSGTIDDVTFYNGVTSVPSYIASKAVDNSTSTSWRSQSEASPAIYVDLTSNREIVGTALNIDKTNTTVTAIKVRASTDTSFADAENIAYINLTDFTDDTWRYIANNFLADDRRYVQIIGVGTGVLAINEIKVRYGVSDLIKILTHRHHTRTVDSADSFVDSN